ncbi:hypothetical protein DSL72_003853 [Monilinia vaccinii-corymbosi]|uniref:DNA2/NAM7 helicase-like C-terminal domain-containing protein n=1 Tax=Monilinia vaccinii-corymbosi TaxID=61207 RepID=A0A8A3P8B1_9HELO|nr:hypothetical protein DSL72_003853 [Monilinia vaccinii-corymbosi]
MSESWLQNFRYKLFTWSSKPRGRDFPTPYSVPGKLTDKRPAVLLLKEKSGGNNTGALMVRYKFDKFSQAPAVKITLDDSNGYTLHIRSNNLLESSGRKLFTDGTFELDLSTENLDKTKKNLANFIKNGFRCPSENHIDALINYAKFGASSKATEPTEELENRMKSILDALNSGEYYVTLVRSYNDDHRKKLQDVLDEHWKRLMRSCVNEGVWNFYARSIGKNAGALFQECQDDPDKKLMHQVWMRETGLDSELGRYAFHVARKTFGTPREMEIAYSVGVIGENMWDTYSISKYFNATTKHSCRVGVERGYWYQLHIAVDKDENFSMPTVAPGTQISFKVVPLPTDPDNSKPSVNQPEGSQPGGSQPEPTWTTVKGMKKIKNSMPPTAQVVEVDTNLDFVLQCQIEDSDERQAFGQNDIIEVYIEMKRNPIPGNRMLKAIGKICGKPTTAAEENLQSFLLGQGVKSQGYVIFETCKDQMTKEQRGAFDLLTKAMNLNRQQTSAWNTVFYKACFASLLQGPPGTGKTNLVGGMGLGLALCGLKTLITGPSNISAREPQVGEWFDIIYLPTRGTTFSDLKEADMDWDLITNIMISEGLNQSGLPSIDDYALWTHIVRSFTEDSNIKDDPAKQTNAKNWLNILNRLKTNQNVAAKDKKKFHKLAELKYGYQPQACINDEAASAAEPDLWIAISLGCWKIITVGDHMQSHPEVKSAIHNEQSKQYGLSMFARFFHHWSAEVVRLRENYRMIDYISNFPGIANYGYLSAHLSTNAPTKAYEAFNKWWISDDAKEYRDRRREPVFGGLKNLQNHRLFVSFLGGRSAPKEGGKSKRNFANINAIRDMIVSLFNSDTTMDLDKITIMTPYKEELNEMSRQIVMSLRVDYPKLGRHPRFRTIDSSQSSENDIVFLAITPADQQNGGLIGFLRDWNRMNVALTRPKMVLVIFGNLDLWRTQLPVITEGLRCKNFGYMMIDLLDLGDVVDVEGNNSLPRSKVELINGLSSWSTKIETTLPENSQLTAKQRSLLDGYDQAQYENQLLSEWKEKRKLAREYQEKEKAGIDYELPAFGTANDDIEVGIDGLASLIETSTVGLIEDTEMSS